MQSFSGENLTGLCDQGGEKCPVQLRDRAFEDSGVSVAGSDWVIVVGLCRPQYGVQSLSNLGSHWKVLNK